MAIAVVGGALVAVGCSQRADVDVPSAQPAPSSLRPRTCADAVIANGFGVSWKNLNHRISALGLGVRSDPSAPCLGGQSARFDAQFIGGDFTTGEALTDVPRAYLAYAVVGAHHADVPSLPTLHAAKNEHILQLESSQAADALVAWPVTPHGDRTRLVVLDGFGFATDVPQAESYPKDYDPAHGYTSRGLSARVADEGGGVRVSAAFRHGPADRPPMNAAIPFATTRAVVRYAAVSVPSGWITRHAHRVEMEYEPQAALDSTPLPRAPIEERRATIVGAPNFSHGAVFVTGFDVRLFPGDSFGDYIREVRVGVESAEFDPGSGTADVVLSAYASNAGFITMGRMHYVIDVELALLEWNGGRGADQLAFETDFETTEPLSVPLPIDRRELSGASADAGTDASPARSLPMALAAENGCAVARPAGRLPAREQHPANAIGGLLGAALVAVAALRRSS